MILPTGFMQPTLNSCSKHDDDDNDDESAKGKFSITI